MTTCINVLDHGYVKAIEHWGADWRVIEAARLSTNKGFLGWGPGECSACLGTGSITRTFLRVTKQGKFVRRVEPSGKRVRVRVTPDKTETVSETIECSGCKGTGKRKQGDEKLLRYLYEHNHASPFEMAGMVFEVQAPIFVFREWHRHRTQSYNEMSARYTPLPDVNYIPSVERLMLNANGTNKQANRADGAQELTIAAAEEFQMVLEEQYFNAQAAYEQALWRGVSKELARLVLPVGRYSRMRASANLRNWLGFLTLRMDPAAQWEIRQYANAVHSFLKQAFPRTIALFDEGNANA